MVYAEGGNQLKVLVVDDEPDLCKVLVRYLATKGYEVETSSSGEEALTMIHGGLPDLVLMDIRMPGIDGIELLEKIRARDEELPIIMVTAVDDTETAVSAMRRGASDYVTKPIDLKDLNVSIIKALEKGRAAREVREYRERLELRIKETTTALTKAVREIEKAHGEIKEAHRDTIYRLSLAAEFRNRETAAHLRRISDYSVVVAQALGWGEEEVENIKLASIMHDIGKIGIPDAILLKRGSLSKEEFDEIKKHSIIGFEILYGSDSHFLRMAQDIVLTHHEKWDGTGYTLGLKGEQIPLSGRVVAVADVFDALTSPRVYKAAFTNGEAYRLIGEGSEKQFDPMVARAFFSCSKAIEEAQRKNGVETWTKVFSPVEDKEDLSKYKRYFDEWAMQVAN